MCYSKLVEAVGIKKKSSLVQGARILFKNSINLNL